MELNDNSSNVCGLIDLLETLLSSTHFTFKAIEAMCAELEILLHGWALPGSGKDVSPSCTCLLSQKQQIHKILDKVEKAVKFSQSVREGRNDVQSPWQEKSDCSLSTEPVKKVISKVGSKPPVSLKPYFGHKKDKTACKGDPDRSAQRLHGFSCEAVSKADLLDEGRNIPDCPKHNPERADDTSRDRRSHNVDIAEALDVLGIPPELVTILKTFHRYINKLQSSVIRNKAEHAFLKHLNAVNGPQWARISVFNGTTPFSNRRKVSKELENTSAYQNDISHWGIWNPSAFVNISVRALFVQYQNEEAWQLLQTRMQQLQLSHIEYKVCDILVTDSSTLFQNLTVSEASIFLKAAIALSRISILSWPSIVQTLSKH